MKTLALALAAVCALSVTSVSAQSVIHPCGKAVKFCSYDPWENSDDTSDRDGGGKVAQTADRK